jgi:hypothetical protein
MPSVYVFNAYKYNNDSMTRVVDGDGRGNERKTGACVLVASGKNTSLTCGAGEEEKGLGAPGREGSWAA